MIGFKKKSTEPKLDEPKKERLGDVLARMNRAQRRSYLSRLKKHFKHQGMNLV